MEIQLRPPFNIALVVLITVITWGLYPLLRRVGERHFIRSMNDGGVRTRGGERIQWNEITGITRVAQRMGGATMSDEYLLTSRRGKVSLPLWRTANATEARNYLLARLPAELL